jgi:hypothetical protein
MTFLHLQLALAGLACVAIPIAIHLLMRRRRKPVMWGAMRFLVEAFKKHRRRLLIEKWLLLATRCLLVALIGLAIGRPLIGAIIGGGTGRTVYIVIDNGLAAGAVGADGASALDRHKTTAKKVLETLQSADAEGDRAALVALGAPAEGVVLPVSADVPAVATLLQGVTPVEARSDLPGAITMIASAIETDRAGGEKGRARGGQTFVIILSDFLEGSADLTASLAKLPDGVKVLASDSARTGLGNVAVIGVEPPRSVVVTGKTDDAGAPATTTGDSIRVLLQRTGPVVSQAGTSTVVLNMAGVRDRGDAATLAEAGRTTVQWTAGQETATAAIQPTRRAGTGSGASGGEAERSVAGTLTEVIEARIQGASASENSVPGDDAWRRPVEVRDALRVGIVAPRRFGARERVDRLEPSEWLRLALRPADDQKIEVTELEPTLLDGARLAGLDAVCLPRPDLLAAEHWPRLRLFLEGGGLLLVMPPTGVQVHLWPDAMVKELDLGWRVAREAKAYGGDGKPPATIASTPQTGAGRFDLLSQVRREMDDLVRPVGIWRVLPVETDRSETRRLLVLEDGTPLLLAQTYGSTPAAPATPPLPTQPPSGESATAPASSAPRSGDRGLVVFLAVAPDLDWTDLPAKPLMVPLIQEIMWEGIGQAHGSWWSIAGSRPVTPSRSEELHPIDLRSGTPGPAREDEAPRVVAVDDTGTTSEPLRRAGLWRALDGRGGARGVVAVNPDTRGGRTQAQDAAALEQWLSRASADGKVAWIDGSEETTPAAGSNRASLTGLLARESPGSPISLPLLIAALVLALFELWLARWASHATVPASPVRKGATA